ncbi:zinc ribbon-containing protein [Catenovulum sp. SX2]|uniref:zinc ribbon-containing protein n=1 Tax=Catenovulum sp. SX2 TaxID=3398614 RepID=UPI003F8672C5
MKANKYQMLMAKFSTWLKDSAEQETRSIAEGVDFLENWLQTGLEVHQQEFYHSWQYFQRDLAYFFDGYQQEANESSFYLTVKDNLWGLLAEMTDRTQLEWREFSSDLDHQGIYKAGEEIAFGRLQCTECKDMLTINHAQKIHPCFECGNQHFTRLNAVP